MHLAQRPAKRERVPIDASALVTVREVTAAAFTYPWHYHPEVELLMVVAGRGLRYVGDSVSEFEEGDLCLVGANTPHCWLSERHPSRPVHAVVVQFPTDVFGNDFLKLTATSPVNTLLQRSALGVWVDGRTRTRVTSELWRLVKESTTALGKLTRLLGILAVLAESKHCATIALATGRQPTNRLDASRAKRVVTHIHEHASDRLSQREMAQMVGLSSGAFSRFFSRHFGKTFVSYVAEVRIGHACRLLVEQEMNVSEVAFAVGFGNLANFNRQFLRRKGMTPTAFRKMARSLG